MTGVGALGAWVVLATVLLASACGQPPEPPEKPRASAPVPAAAPSAPAWEFLIGEWEAAGDRVVFKPTGDFERTTSLGAKWSGAWQYGERLCWVKLEPLGTERYGNLMIYEGANHCCYLADAVASKLVLTRIGVDSPGCSNRTLSRKAAASKTWLLLVAWTVGDSLRVEPPQVFDSRDACERTKDQVIVAVAKARRPEAIRGWCDGEALTGLRQQAGAGN